MPRRWLVDFGNDLPARLGRAARIRLLLPVCAALALALALGGAAASNASPQASAAAPHARQDQPLMVAPTGSDTDVDGSPNNCMSSPCLTIGHAVAEASSGDTIQIAAGTYNEIVKTSLNLTFIGAGPDATVVNSTGLTYSDGNPYGAFALSGTDTVEDLKAEDFDSGIGGAVSVSGAGAVTLDDVDVNTDGQTAGTDGIGAGGQSLTVNDSTISVTNNDADVANSSTSSDVVQDGSGIEATAGTVSVSDSTISTVDGISLRLHAVTGATGPTSTTVRDSLLEVSGTEDIASGQTGYANDQWQTIEDAAGSLTLISDTVYNATVGRSTSSPQAPTDALWVAPVSGLQVTIDNSILRAQQQQNYESDGSDIDANESVSASFSSFSSVYAHGDATVTANDADGNIPGDPGFNDAAGGDFTLAPGSALIGAGDPRAVSPGELDLAGGDRAISCLENGSDTPTDVLNIGAYETSAPSCPAAVSSDDSTGALTQLTGAFNCVTGQNADGSPCATSGVPGMTGDDPNDVVQSPDGQNVYVASEDPSGAGVEIAEFSRGTGGGLTQLAVPNNCLSSSSSDASGCGIGSVASLDYSTDDGDNTPIVEPVRMAISPDGTDLYIDTGLEIAGFTRDPSTGALAPFPASECISFASSTGPGSQCAVTNDEKLFEGPAALAFSPDGSSLYLATIDSCSHGESPLRARVASEASDTLAGDPQNPNCSNNSEDAFFASAQLDLFSRDPSSGALTAVACYANSATADGCTGGFDGLYAMTSVVVSPDGNSVYVTGGAGGTPNPNAGVDGVPLGDPGQISELVRDPADGTLTQGSGAGACITAGSHCDPTTGNGTTEVPGLIDPQQIVVSPDGAYAYVVSSQYYSENLPSDVDTGELVSSDVVSLTRDPMSGALAAISGGTCFAGFEEACASDDGPYPLTVQVPGLQGAESVAISPDGQNVYVAAGQANVAGGAAQFSGAVAFSRDSASGSLTPLSAPDTCLTAGIPDGASGVFACGDTSVAGLSGAFTGLPGWILVSPDCENAYVLSSGLAEFARAQPAGGPSCPGGGGSSGGGGSGSGAISLSTAGLNFGTVGLPVSVGAASALQTVTITNPSTVQVTLGTLSIAGGASSPFAIVQGQDGCSAQMLAPGHSCTVAIVFDPQSADTVGDQLLIPSSAGATQKLGLTGVGGQGQATLSTTLLGFGTSGGEVAVGTTSPAQKVTVTDSGREPLTFGTLSVTAGGPFQLSGDACSGQTLQPSGTCTVTVAMAPTGAGAFAGTLTIPDNAPTAGSQQTVVLKGDAAVAAISLDMTSLQWSGTAYQVKTVTVTNSGPALLTIGSIGVTTAGAGAAAFSLASGSDCANTSLVPAATCTIGVDFTPVAPGADTGTVDVDDDVPGSPQTVALSGSAAGGTLSGTVTGPGGGPVAGVVVYACTAGEGPSTCTGTDTAADGSYSLSLVAGTWRLQLSAPNGYDDASSVDQVLPGQAVTQDFSLHAPVPLAAGVSFNGPNGSQTSGVPTVNWEQPFAINQSVAVSPTGPPNSTQIYYDVSGIGDDTGTISGSAFNLAGLAVFGVRYGADGQAEGMTDPLEAEIDCQPTAGSPSPCAALIPDPSSLPAGTSQVRGALRGVVGSGAAGGVDPAAGGVDAVAASASAAEADRGPTAHAAIDCPAAAKVGFNIVPDMTYGGVDFVYTEPDGTQHVFILGNVAIAPLSSTGNAFADGALNVGRLGINFALNFNPYIGAYNAFINALQALTISAHSNNMQLQGLENGNAIIQLLVAALNAETHGAAYWVGQVFSGIFSYSANYENGLQVQATPNCPPKSNDFYIDPSGTVQTTKKVPVDGATVTLKRSATANGKLGRVPAGSTLLSPANRRNPDHSTVTGAFGWDVAPGYYKISASHSGCRSPKAGGGSAATTPLLGVPPEQTDLTLTLSCPHLRRSASRVALSVIAGPDGMHALQARISAKGHRKVPAGDLVGSVTFRAGGKSLGAVPVDLDSGAATLDVPALKTAVRSFAATYSGNGLYAPSTTSRSAVTKPAKKQPKK